MTIDVFASDALGHMAAHLSGPLGAGVRQFGIALDSSGAGSVVERPRHPLLLVVLTSDLDAVDHPVDVTVGTGDPIRVRFAGYSERGAMLPVPLPAGDAPIAVHVTPHDGIELRLVDGALGRLLYLLSAEKVRLRRVARELAAARRLTAARDDGLDRLGVELRVPRFRAQLSWSDEESVIVATPGDETDASFRDRLAIYRPHVRPTRTALETALPGLMARVGYTGHLAIRESDTELAIAVRVASPPNDARRLTHLAYIRRQFLLPVEATELPPDRLVSIAERSRARDLLARLKQTTTWPEGAHIAPSIAVALDRAARCAAALGGPDTVEVTRAQRDDGGSRYELGAGADIRGFGAGVAQQMADALRSGSMTGTPDPEIELLLSKMTPTDAAQDPDARWLFRGCGLRTVHPIGNTSVFASHLPIHGATMDIAAGSTALELSAVLRAEGDLAMDARLAGALAHAADDPPSWTLVPLSSLAGATPPPAPAVAVFASAGLAAPTDAAAVTAAVGALGSMPGELVAALRADPGIGAGVLAGNEAAAEALRTRVDRLSSGGAVAILPLVIGGAVFLVVGATDLPGKATVFNRRRADFRWMAAPLEADQRIGTLAQPQGTRNRYLFAGQANDSQVAAIVAMTPVRADARDPHRRVDPYTVAVELVDGDQPLLSFHQYEYLMNLLDRWCPVGITIDTSRLRAHGVDVDGDGTADLLPLRLQRTFRPFRARRAFGARI